MLQSTMLRPIEDRSTWTDSSSRRPSPQKSNQHRIAFKQLIPREHGVWPMFLVPLLVGAGVAPISDGMVGLLLSAAIFAHVARYELLLLVRLRAKGGVDRRAFLLFLSSSALAFTSALFLVLEARWLLLSLGGGALLFMALHTFLALKRTERSIHGELLGIAGLTMTAPAAYYVAAGELNVAAFTLWLLSFLYFGRSVFYVKMKVAAHGKRGDFRNLWDRLRFSRNWRINDLR